ncbi:ABC transporter permease subunit [Idiomarina seosinensis]|uniref:ABC transporter permease subunit n=1 Tax=Idiomarina seosinensis TaxID=281739 RepID=UPI003850CCD8
MVRALSVTVLLLLVIAPLTLAVPALWPTELLNQPFERWPDLPWNSVVQAFLLTLFTGLLVAGLSLTAAQKLNLNTRGQSRGVAGLSVVLSTPHVAFAVGLMFLFSPSGYLVRLLEAVTGWLPSPPTGWPLPEKSLVTLTLVLVLKEVPFLLLMAATQLRQLPYQRWLRQSQSLGWSKSRGWWLLVVPALLPRIKLPLAAIVIYTLSVVDIPLLLGPNTPGVLAQEVFKQHYQWGREGAAQLGVGLLLLLALVFLLINHGAVRGYVKLAAYWRSRALKDSWAGVSLLSAILPGVILLSALVLLALLINSLAGAWFYPQLAPADWSPQRWQTEWPYLAPLLWNSLWLALASALLGVLAAVAVLERQRRRKLTELQWLPLLLLLIPQLVLVLGWQKIFGQGSQGPVLLWSHTVFCFPYAYLVLHGAWVNFNEHWLYQAQSLGYSYRQAWWRILLPMLSGPLWIAFAVAFSVSIAQYLPTIWLAGGTLPTLTTEAVSIASGGDWRLASVYALMQALLPLIVFTLLIRQSLHVKN